MLARICFSLLVIFVITSDSFAKEPEPIEIGSISSKGLSFEQAKKIFLAVMKHNGRNIENVEGYLSYVADENKKPSEHNPGFFGFYLMNDDPEAPSLSGSGWYAISIYTGDVLTFTSCDRTTFPALQVLQKQIMKKTEKTLEEERKTWEVALDCFEGD